MATTWLSLVLLGSLLWHPATANTEIVHFLATPDYDAHIPHAAHWPTLDAAAPARLFHLLPAPAHTPPHAVCAPPAPRPCPHELVLALDPAPGAPHTLRLSWPASSPARFRAEILRPADAAPPSANASARAPTRRRYARIRAVHAGAAQPGPAPAPVPVVVVLERLYFGALPASVARILLLLVPLAGAAGCAVPWAVGCLERVAGLARDEVDGAGTKSKSKRTGKRTSKKKAA